MAIDTRNKRASVLHVFSVGRVYPNPDGSLANSTDRTHMGTRYAGIPGDPLPGTVRVPWKLFIRGSI